MLGRDFMTRANYQTLASMTLDSRLSAFD
jgi:hypothetical protein